MSDILFLGRHDCQYSDRAAVFLEEIGFNISYIKSKFRNEILPKDINEWQGKYILCFRSFFVLPIEVINRASVAAINFHPGPPEYPGSGCINFALYDDVKQYGVTAHLMTNIIDSGQILECSRFSVAKSDNIDSLLIKTHEQLFNLFCSFCKNLYKVNENFLEMKIKDAKTEKWKGAAKKISELERFQIIEPSITKEELNKRIRAFHTNKYPLQMKIHGKNFYLKK